MSTNNVSTRNTAVPEPARILVLDDEPDLAVLFATVMRSAGHDVEIANDLAGARSLLARKAFDVVLADKNLPDGSGLDLVQNRVDSDYDVVIVTAHADVASAVDALRLNVADYLVKPLPSMQYLRNHIERVLEMRRLHRRNAALLAELQAKNEALEAMVRRDPLTGLYNHAYFQEHLEREIQRSLRYGLSFALLFIDVDRFKEVNDRFGHLAGDALLKRLAGILKGEDRRLGEGGFSLRQSDVSARYGGDEFAVILPETSKAGAAVKAEALRRHVADQRARGPIPYTLSIGLASFPEDGKGRTALIGAADTGLYTAKRAGRNRMITFTAGLAQRDQAPSGEIDRIQAFDRTLLERRFEYVYQPLVWRGGRLFGYEALLRPSDPAFPNPGALIEAAAAYGRVADLGRLLRPAAATVAPWLPADVNLFVNLHPHELADPLLMDGDPLLDRYADRIVFEITETMAISDFDRVKVMLSCLRERGFRIALDDVGAGYSGLTSLAMLEPDFVKLDIGLVRALRTNRRVARLVRHLQDYADGEGIMTIAEGVETAAECSAVEEIGCPLMQGYLFGRPEPFDRQAATSRLHTA